jgi:hypothetical protein
MCLSRSGYVNYPQLVQDALSPRGGTAPPLDALAKTAAGSLTVKPSALQASAAYPGTGQFGRPAAQGVRPIAAGAEQDKPHARDEVGFAAPPTFHISTWASLFLEASMILRALVSNTFSSTSVFFAFTRALENALHTPRTVSTRKVYRGTNARVVAPYQRLTIDAPSLQISSRPSSAPMTRSAAARGVTFSEQQRTEQYCPTAHLVDAAAVHMEHMKNKRRPNSAFGVGLRYSALLSSLVRPGLN